MKTSNHILNNYNLSIETLTPLHVGSGQMLSSVGDFIITNNKIRYLDTEKISKFLLENDKVETYLQKIHNTPTGFNNQAELKELGFSIESAVLNETELCSNQLNVLNNNILHLFIDANGPKYIPGSSVKGMIKTVLLFHYLRENHLELSKIEKEILGKSNFEKKKFFSGLKVMWESFEKVVFNSKEFNNLRFTDSPYLSNGNIQVEQVKRQHLFNVDSEGLDWLAETVKSETIFPIRMQILPEFSPNQSALNVPEISGLFKLINEYSIAMIDFEIKMLDQTSFCDKSVVIQKLTDIKAEILNPNIQSAICRLGKGKTIYFNTIWSLLSQKVINLIVEKLRGEEEGNALFSATRVLTVNNEMLGWIKISELEPSQNSFHALMLENDISELENHPKVIVPAINKKANLRNQETRIMVTVVSPKLVTFVLNDQKYETFSSSIH